MDDAAKSLDTEDDLVLRVWDGDEAVLGDLLISYGPSIERAIALQFSNLAKDAEDIVAEAFQRFWKSRDRYNAKQSLRAYLFKIAVNVARNLASGHLGWQKSRNLEQQIDDEWLHSFEQPPDTIDDELDEAEDTQKGICKALRESLNVLSDIERVVIDAYAVLKSDEANATELGVELGKRHCNGVPIPGGTIRQHKRRAKTKLFAEMRKRGYELENIGVRQ